MDITNSVSKGVFVFKNGATRTKGRKKAQHCSSFLNVATRKQLWYRSYSSHWKRSQDMIQKLQTSSYSKIRDDLYAFIEQCHQKTVSYEGVLPTAALLTGINQTDHLSQFDKLADDIRNNTLALVILLQSREASSVKQAIEMIVGKFIESYTKVHGESDENSEPKFRKNQLNLSLLDAWYSDTFKQYEQKVRFVIILPDFELFNPVVLQDVILILDAHSHTSPLPFVLVFGVATAVTTIHSVLPYHVTSKIKLSIFQSEPSVTNLNKILNEVLLTPYCPFHLSGKAFQLLLDIFLFYDFSVNGFIQGFKYAFMDHYYGRSINALSSIIDDKDDINAIIDELSTAELEQIRQLPSFRPYVESLQNPQDVVDLLTDDAHLKRSLPTMVIRVHNYWFTFHCALEILQTLVSDLPKAPLGKQLRELYCQCVSADVSELAEFKECLQLLSFLSREEMMQKVKDVLIVLLAFIQRSDQLSMKGCLVYEVVPLEEMADALVKLSDELMAAKHEQIFENVQQEQQCLLSPGMGRQELREKLLTAAKHTKNETGVARAVGRITEYMVNNIFRRYLQPPTPQTVPLIELFLYSDSASMRRHIVGAPRAAVHTALNNPQYYTQCDCCLLDESSSIVPSLPDLSIAYKLHLECGRMINLFDWLQAFRTVIDDTACTDAEEQQIDPTIQARFTRAVAELQFLGFIKTSKTKTDHVTRLTW
uniref:Origin recognition complex subunit 3 n=1 Tax=Anopheles dirus TaxID=7168 RepID=A0A182NDI2_9DIPT